MLRSSTLSDCQWARSPCRRRSWALCPGRRLAPPPSSRGACQQPRVGPADPGRTGRLPPRRMGSHAVFPAQLAWASPILYAAFPRLTAAWKRKEETLSPQPPAGQRRAAGGHAAPCRVCRRRPALGASVFGPGHPLRSLQQPPCPRRWRGAGVRRAQPGRALPTIFAIVLPRRRTRSLQLQTFRRPLLASASPSCRLEAGKGERFLFGPAGVRSAQTGRARRLSSPPFRLPGGAPARCSFGLVVLPLRFPACGFRSVAYSVYLRPTPFVAMEVRPGLFVRRPARCRLGPLLSVTTSVGPGLVLTETHAPASWPTLIGRRVIERTAPGLTPRL